MRVYTSMCVHVRMSSSMSVYVYVTSLSAGDLPCDVQHVVSWSGLLKNTHPDRHRCALLGNVLYEEMGNGLLALLYKSSEAL